jgi:uncharacterized DUF497 family protein
VFGDPLSVTYCEPDHSVEEQRFVTVGMSKSERLSIMAMTIAVIKSDKIRVIGARITTKRERKFHEQEN